MRILASVFAAGFCVLSATSAHATNRLRLLDVCLSAESDINAMTARLSQFGWTETSQPTEALAHGLKWIGTTQYFTTDSGGEMVETILSLKEKTAAGLLRKKDIPQSKNRFLLREDEVLHLMWRKPTPSETEIECHAALTSSTTNAVRRGFGETTSAFTRLPTQTVNGGQVEISLLDDVMLAPHAPPDAVLRTYLRVQNQ